MTHLDIELKNLRADMHEMFGLVYSQLTKARNSLVNFDKDLAREVRVNEKRVNSSSLNSTAIVKMLLPFSILWRLICAWCWLV